MYRLKYYILFFILTAAVFGMQTAGILDPLTLLLRTLSVNIYPLLNSAFMTMLGLVEHYAPEGLSDVAGRIYTVLRGTVPAF